MAAVNNGVLDNHRVATNVIAKKDFFNCFIMLPPDFLCFKIGFLFMLASKDCFEVKKASIYCVMQATLSLCTSREDVKIILGIRKLNFGK